VELGWPVPAYLCSGCYWSDKWWKWWSYNTCKAPAKSSPTNQHPVLFTGRMPFLSPNQQCQSTEGKLSHLATVSIIINIVMIPETCILRLMCCHLLNIYKFNDATCIHKHSYAFYTVSKKTILFTFWISLWDKLIPIKFGMHICDDTVLQMYLILSISP